VPCERGALPTFAAGLRALLVAERGRAELAVLPEWP
jgi:hypothetical protein